MRLRYRRGDTVHEVEVTPLGDGGYEVSVDGVALRLAVRRRGDAFDLAGRDGTVRAWVGRDGARRFVTAPGIGEVALERVEGRRAAAGREGGGDLSSPMPGRVVRTLVAAGDRVAKGQPLVVVEAMKTELTIAAPRAARVARVDAREGEMCEAGRPLVELAEDADGAASGETGPRSV